MNNIEALRKSFEELRLRVPAGDVYRVSSQMQQTSFEKSKDICKLQVR